MAADQLNHSTRGAPSLSMAAESSTRLCNCFRDQSTNSSGQRSVHFSCRSMGGHQK